MSWRSPIHPEQVLALARRLDAEGVPYAFIGAIAMNAWGIPRATYDFDAVVALDQGAQAGLLRSFRELGYVVDEVYERGYRDTMAGMPIIHVSLPSESTYLRVDLVIAETEFLRSLIARKVSIEFDSGSILVCRPADLILLKLMAWRLKDRADIENLLTVQGVPEPAYLEDWARKLGVARELAEAVKGLDGPEP